jgi:A/G-specific adenine glycosylase
LPEAGDHDEARGFLARHVRADFDAAQVLPLIEHTFSHYRLHIEPLAWRIGAAAAVGDNAGLRWLALDRLDEVGLPAPVKKLLGSLSP